MEVLPKLIMLTRTGIKENTRIILLFITVKEKIVSTAVVKLKKQKSPDGVHTFVNLVRNNFKSLNIKFVIPRAIEGSLNLLETFCSHSCRIGLCERCFASFSMTNFVVTILFIPHRLDRLQIGGFSGGENPKSYSDKRRDR